MLFLSDKAIILTASIKGICMAYIITVIADTSFLQGLATAISSALVSGTFLLVSIHMSGKRNEIKAQEVKREVLEGQEKMKDEVVKKVEENH